MRRGGGGPAAVQAQALQRNLESYRVQLNDAQQQISRLTTELSDARALRAGLENDLQKVKTTLLNVEMTSNAQLQTARLQASSAK